VQTAAPYLRIGSVAITAEGLLLPVAGAFFALILYRAVYPDLETRRMRAILLTIACGLCAGTGARIYGLVQPIHLGEPVLANGAWIEARFGSFGAISAILAVLALYGRTAPNGALNYTDAAIPAICAGSAIARVSCLFQGCCPSVSLGHLGNWLSPAYLWPSLDIAALGVVFALTQAVRIRYASVNAGLPTIVFLCAYGLMRFGIEFARDTYTLTGPLTYGQILALVQLTLGLYMMRGLWVLETPSEIWPRRSIPYSTKHAPM